MKIFEVINNESDNEILKTLYRRQKARTYEFILDWNRIKNRKFSIDTCIDMSAVGFRATAKNNQHIFDLNPKVFIKFNRMIEAKKEFEKAGGNYEDP